MLTYLIDDMTCGHCASSIAKAVRAVDADASVRVDLAQHLVIVKPSQADARRVADAISEAGYTPVAVEAVMAVAEPDSKSACCGCRG